MRPQLLAAVLAGLLSGPCVARAQVRTLNARGLAGGETRRFFVRVEGPEARGKASVAIEGGKVAGAILRAGTEAKEIAPAGGALSWEIPENPRWAVALQVDGSAGTRIRLGMGSASAAETAGRLCSQAAACGPLRAWVSCVEPAEPLSAIARPKPLVRRTLLAEDSRPAAAIVAPAGGSLDGIARRLQADLQQRFGARLEILHDDAVLDAGGQPRGDHLRRLNLVALGNLTSNRLLTGLWGRGYVFCDALYPGPGGYEARTVHDPYGAGRNVVVLGGSDAEGVALAARAFVGKHVARAGAEVAVPGMVLDVSYRPVDHPAVPPAWPKRQPQFRDRAYFLERLKTAGLMDDAGNPLALKPAADVTPQVADLLASMGALIETYTLLGDETWARWAHDLFLRNRHLIRALVAAPHADMAPSFPHAVRLWDLIEEHPLWTDEERLEMTNLLLAVARTGHERRSVHTLVKEGCRQVYDENHATFSAWFTYEDWSYFGRYYDLPDAAYWLAVADAIFEGQLCSHQMPEDACGYMTYCPRHAMLYAACQPDPRYFTGGIAGRLTDYAVQCVNNLGLDSGFGDHSGLVPEGVLDMVARTGLFTGDGRCRWLMENLFAKGAGLRAYQMADRMPFRADVPARRPDDLLGMWVAPLFPRPLAKGEGVSQPVAAEERPVAGRFKKIAFRDNWTRDGQYLLLDGGGQDSHSHQDVNSVINFTSHGRMWLVDHDYGLKTVRDHSGIMVSCDGQGARLRSDADLRHAVQFDDFAASRSRIAGYQGMEWDRDILWLRGRYFVVLDTLAATRAGSYFARASWRGLGKEQLAGANFALEQKGMRCTLATDGAAELDTESYEYPEGDWGVYPHAAPVAKILRENRYARLQPGQALRFANALHVGPADGAQPVSLERLAPAAWRLRVGDEVSIAGTGPATLGGLQVDAAAWLLRDGTAYLAEGRSLRAGGVALFASETPAGARVDLARRRVDRVDGSVPGVPAARPVPAGTPGAAPVGVSAARPAPAGTPGAAPVGVPAARPVPAGTPGAAPVGGAAQVGKPELPEAARAAWDAAFAALARMPAAAPEAAPDAGPARSGLAARVLGTFGSPVRALATDGDRVAAGLQDGRVLLLSPEGQEAWRFTAKGPILSLCFADLDGDGRKEVVAGSEDRGVTALAADGRLLWRFECEKGGRSAGQPAARFVLPVDLDGDGKSEVAVGSTYVYALGGDGKVRWRDRFAHWRGADLGECRALSVADVNGDGRGEVIASYYAPYAATRVLDGDGKALQSARLNTGGAGFYTNTPLCNTTLDLDGDGKSEVLVGDTQFVLGSAPAAAEPQGQLLWMGAATHLGSVARKGEGPLLAAALESGDVVALRHRASAGPFVVDGAWCAGVRARITGFQAADLDGDGTAEVVVATRRRGLRVLTAAGKESAWDAETAPDVAVLAAGAGCVLGGTADGRLIRWVRER